MLYSIATDVNSELYQLGFSPCCLLFVPKAVNSALWLQTLLSSLCPQGCQLCTLASDLVFSLFPRLSTLASDFVVFSLFPRLSTLHSGFRPCCLLSVPKAANSGFRPCCLLFVPKAVSSELCMLASDLVVFFLFPRLSTPHSGFRLCCLLSVPKAVNSAPWLQTLLSSLCPQGCQL